MNLANEIRASLKEKVRTKLAKLVIEISIIGGSRSVGDKFRFICGTKQKAARSYGKS